MEFLRKGVHNSVSKGNSCAPVTEKAREIRVLKKKYNPEINVTQQSNYLVLVYIWWLRSSVTSHRSCVTMNEEFIKLLSISITPVHIYSYVLAILISENF